MQRFLRTASVSVLLASVYVPAAANEELLKIEQDPKQWVMQTGDYANRRFSGLKRITPDNVGKLQVAWTFSTGVLRGHEGGPLVIVRRQALTRRLSIRGLPTQAGAHG
jgi:alcohol dehydrogenase (cytochrome c)